MPFVPTFQFATMKSSLPLIAVVSLSLPALNSCYFNSAGHLFEKASYHAAADMADLKPGSNIYTDGQNYYVELPRYRAGKPVRTQMAAFGQEQVSAKLVKEPEGESVVVSIPADYAMYLAGKSKSPSEPSFMVRVKEDIEDIKGRCQSIPAVRTPKESRCYFTYTSPAAAGWYTLGVLDWLCVDLPVTCVENSLMLCGGFLFVMGESMGSPRVDSNIDASQGFMRDTIKHDTIIYSRKYY